jgi:murein L,D-transpeptidase YcbB/YkuD
MIDLLRTGNCIEPAHRSLTALEGFTLRNAILAVLILFNLGIARASAAVDDAAVTQLLHSQVAANSAGKPAATLRTLALQQAVAQFYAQRSDAPAWRDSGRVEQLFKALDNLRTDGLNPEDYQLAELRQRYTQLSRSDASAQAVADFDLLASSAYLRSLAHLFRGKVNPKTFDAQWNFEINDMTAADALAIVNKGISSGDIHAVYERARPQHPFYMRSRNALAQLQGVAANGGWPRIELTTTLKPGESNPQVVNLRKRFSPGTDASTAGNIYDSALADAVKKFQREQYLNDDGSIGPTTRAALNVSVQQRIDQVRINLERGRWLLHDLPSAFVLVDIAGYKIYFYRDGQPVWQSQVQIGKPYRKTPIFKSAINTITFNPTWTVPPTILRNDVLPKIRKDTGYLARNNMRVLSSNGTELDPKTVNWSNPGNVVIRQDAGGDHAALGRVVIRFPNEYAVYLHDTPHKELFDNTQRAFSSGCIRVERPFELVELIFNDPEKWNQASMDELVAQEQTRNISVPKPVPVLLAYWTIDVFKDGDIGFKPDIYSRDPTVLKALNAKL